MKGQQFLKLDAKAPAYAAAIETLRAEWKQATGNDRAVRRLRADRLRADAQRAGQRPVPRGEPAAREDAERGQAARRDRGAAGRQHYIGARINF